MKMREIRDAESHMQDDDRLARETHGSKERLDLWYRREQLANWTIGAVLFIAVLVEMAVLIAIAVNR